MKQYITILAMALLLLTGGVVRAEDINIKRKEEKRPEDTVRNLKKAENAIRAEKPKGETPRVENRVQATSGEAVRVPKETREETRKALEEKKTELKAGVETRKLEARTKLEEKKTALKEKLAVIKDEKKKQIVERVAEKFTAVNEKIVEHFGKAVDKMESLLKRIENRADTVEEGGTNVQAARDAIAGAFTAIEEARVAIRDQAGKVYAVSDIVENEETLKEDISELRGVLNGDLAGVREKLTRVKEAIREAVQTLAAQKSENDTESVSE
ncbi:MAG: hypothetical protein Q8P01_02260 [bacterium]|nr:hypothetical protein [bacterium]